MPSTPQRIALILDKDVSYWRKIVRGILESEAARTQWSIHSVRRLDDKTFERIRRWDPDGVLVGIADAATPGYLDRLDVPCVDIGENPLGDRPRVEVDQHAVGQLAAEHFLERGLRSFAYFGYADRTRDQRQFAGYAQRVAEAYPDAKVHHVPSMSTLDMSRAWTSVDDDLGQWIAGLPQPLALMISDDEAGLWLSQVCKHHGLTVPDDVALLGVNDDSLNCDLSRPALTSVQTPLRRLGREACRLLEQLMDGQDPPDRTLSLPPLRLTVRQSTNLLMIRDDQLRHAIRFIHASAHRPIGVEDVLDQVAVSRRVLERRFRQHLGRTPLQEIRRAHVERARELLAATDDGLQAIADASGFSSIYHLCRVFKRETGETATDYRQKFRR
ncbi:MAG: DNA-binding transcriptional regulator [Planctomycetota bacterium]